jgi:uncharacterized membrane protein
MKNKNLSMKVTMIIDLTTTLVGALTFSTLATIMITKNFTTMMTLFIQVIMGVTLVGRMVPSSKLLVFAAWFL